MMALIVVSNVIGGVFDIQQLRDTVANSRFTWEQILSYVFYAVFIIVVINLIRKVNGYRKIRYKPISESDKEKLITAIVDLKEKAISLADSADSYFCAKQQGIDVNSWMYERQKRYTSYCESREKLKTQILISGKAASDVISGYLSYVETNIDDYMELPGSRKPTGFIQFKASIENLVTYTSEVIHNVVTAIELVSNKEMTKK